MVSMNLLVNMKKMMKQFFCGFFAFGMLFYTSCKTEVREFSVSNLFSDHMVLQQRSEADIWGRYTQGGKVKITTNWGEASIVKANASGKWKAKLKTPKAGGPFEISIETADSTVIIKDVLIGEVWLASGQSNMDISLEGWLPNDTIENSAHAISNATNSNIRFFKVPFRISNKPKDTVQGYWEVTSPNTIGSYSAVAYFFAEKLAREINVPIGIIQSSIGGTPAEAWTSKDYLQKIGAYEKELVKLESIDEEIDNWFKKWKKKDIPSTKKEWEKIDFSDQSAKDISFDDSGWSIIVLPGRFDLMESGELDGCVWLRRQFEIDDISQSYTLQIGAVDDMDKTFINGHFVGGLMGAGVHSTPRSFTVPKSILKKGQNTIAIRAIDTGGPGSVNGPMVLQSDTGAIVSLDGEWKKQVVSEAYDGKYYVYDLMKGVSDRPDISIFNSNSPSVLFNAMIHPLLPYAIKGVIWYQGETNVGRANLYKTIFPNMIEDWRNKWNMNLPFYYVQIAPYTYEGHQKGKSQNLRNAQREALKLPNTGMVVTLDLGSLTTVHPPQTLEVGERLALFALKNEYGKEVIASGPMYLGSSIIGNKIEVLFDCFGSELRTDNSNLFGFEIAAEDLVFYPAEVEVLESCIIVSSNKVPAPKHVRYAWSDTSSAVLFNVEGLPASTFSTSE
jgi:sialate O-acetylesterase